MFTAAGRNAVPGLASLPFIIARDRPGESVTARSVAEDSSLTGVSAG